MTEADHECSDGIHASSTTEVQLTKAKAELAKWEAIKKGLDLSEDAGKFVGKIFGSSFVAAGGIVGDQFRYWRVLNANRLGAKMAAMSQERNVDLDNAKALPFGDAVRALDAATMEDDENVLDLWAKLLVGAIDPTTTVSVKKAYVDLLKSFGSAEASLMEFLWLCYSHFENAKMTEIRQVEAFLLGKRTLSWGQIPHADQNTAIQNLVRLRCITYRPTPPQHINVFKRVRERNNIRTEVNQREFERLLQYLEDMMLETAGVKDAPRRSRLHVGGGF